MLVDLGKIAERQPRCGPSGDFHCIGVYLLVMGECWSARCRSGQEEQCSMWPVARQLGPGLLRRATALIVG